MSEKKLSLQNVTQDEIAWCWAAAAEMVLKYYGGQGVDQCKLANDRFNRTDCCQYSVPQACNQGISIRDVGLVYTEWQVKKQLHPGPVAFSTLKDEVEKDRPVEVVYKLNGGFEHAVIVRGYREDGNGQFVIVNDPDVFGGVSDQPFQDFRTAEGRGQWWKTWTGLQL